MSKSLSETQFERIMQILSNAEELFRELNNAIGQQISQASAYRKYGRVRVNRWAKEGKVNPVRQLNRIYYDAYELVKASKENVL